MTTYVIDRSKWGRNVFYDARTGNMCVLGQVATQRGACMDTLEGLASFTDKDLPDYCTAEFENIINANDFLEGVGREAALQAIFRAHGDDLLFVDGPGIPVDWPVRKLQTAENSAD